MGLESNGRPTKVAYVRYYYTAVKRLSRTSRYYPVGISKSRVHLILLSVHLCTIHNGSGKSWPAHHLIATCHRWGCKEGFSTTPFVFSSFFLFLSFICIFYI
jgi:hypothetical protein